MTTVDEAMDVIFSICESYGEEAVEMARVVDQRLKDDMHIVAAAKDTWESHKDGSFGGVPYPCQCVLCMAVSRSIR